MPAYLSTIHPKSVRPALKGLRRKLGAAARLSTARRARRGIACVFEWLDPDAGYAAVALRVRRADRLRLLVTLWRLRGDCVASAKLVGLLLDDVFARPGPRPRELEPPPWGPCPRDSGDEAPEFDVPEALPPLELALFAWHLACNRGPWARAPATPSPGCCGRTTAGKCAPPRCWR